MGHKKLGSRPKKEYNRQDTFRDVALSDFANASLPQGCGRLRKSTAKRLFENGSTELPEDEEGETSATVTTNSQSKGGEGHSTSEANENGFGLYLADELWLLLSEYMRPQDVTNFALICRSSYRIVNSQLFWIKLYKRYYSTKVYVPTFLKKHCLERRQGLKSKVIRSLFYTYPMFRETLKKNNSALQTVVGHRCDLMWVQRASDKEINANNTGDPIIERWIYSFKLSHSSDDSRSKSQSKKRMSLDINHNPDESCRLLEVVCKSYVDPKCVIGMKLRKATIDGKNVQLKFSSAPLSQYGTDFGAIDIYLTAIQPPSIFGWWHPHFYNQQY